MIIKRPKEHSRRWKRKFYWWPTRFPDEDSTDLIWWQWAYEEQIYFDLWAFGLGGRWYKLGDGRIRLTAPEGK